MSFPKRPGTYAVTFKPSPESLNALTRSAALMLQGRECRLTPVSGQPRGTLTFPAPWPDSGRVLTLVATLLYPSSRKASHPQFVLNVVSTPEPDPQYGNTHLAVTWTGPVDLPSDHPDGAVFLKVLPLETL